MQCFQGKSVYKGIAMGPIVVLKKDDYQVKRTRIEDPEAEVKRVDAALEKSKEQLQKLYDKAVKEVGEASAAIFEVHQMMLEDDDYLEAIQNTICTEQVNAEYAVATTGDNFAEMFASMDDDYMKARSADIKDISERLVRNLSGQEDTDLSSIDPSVIVADDLSPSETVQMDKDKILAFVTVHGSTNSHTAILARMMNIPALIGVPMDLDELKTGMTAVVDGFEGTVTFDPDEEIKAQTEKRMEEEAEKLKLLQELKGKENVTLDGHKINIYANIGSVGDIGYVLENDAGGIGLFRSEFLYLGRNDFPTEEEQFQAYKQAVQMMAGKKVIIRTLDIGADKQVDYFNLGNEDNPALGHTAELAEALNQELSAKWSRLRGIEIVSLGVSGVKASEEDEQMIKELQRSAAFMDPTRAAAHLVGAQASAMQAAASNTAAGPAMAFMGMNQAAAAGGVNARDLYQMGGQQTAAQPQAAPAAGWTCSCGHTGNTGKFCAECGKPRPEAPAVWVCSCGAKNTGKFCSECGKPRPAARCANCGFVPADPANPPKFCPECGKPFGA